jgi:5-methylcytosine-specific restriction endonuclease McrA
MPHHANSGSFKKGHNSWNKGLSQRLQPRYAKHHSDEAKRRISESITRWHEKNKGIYKGEKNPFYGKKHSGDTRRKNSAAHKGRCPWNKNLVGICSEETKEKMSRAHTGKTGPNSSHWKGGITPAHQSIRNSSRTQNWRTAVFERDRYTCQKCGDKKGGNLNAHHILPFTAYPEQRFNVANGITLCDKCHRGIH